MAVNELQAAEGRARAFRPDDRVGWRRVCRPLAISETRALDQPVGAYQVSRSTISLGRPAMQDVRRTEDVCWRSRVTTLGLQCASSSIRLR